MKIVHQIHAAPQVTGGNDSRDNWCSILIVSRDPITGEEDPIYIEGTLTNVRKALEDALYAVEAVERWQQKKEKDP